MDQYLDTQRHEGKLQLEEGAFKLDARAAFEKMRAHRVDDETFPYWKFLQFAAVKNAMRVDFSLSRSSITMIAQTTTAPPKLSEFCNQLPCDDPLLEALKSCALALSSDGGKVEWFREGPRGENPERASLNGDSYDFYEGPRPDQKLKKRSDQAHRLVLEHCWTATGNFWEKLSNFLQRRTLVEKALTEKTDFYPIPLYHSGHLWVLPVLDPHVPERTSTGRPLGLYYQMLQNPDNKDRFLTEGLSRHAFGAVAKLSTETKVMSQVTVADEPSDSCREVDALILECLGGARKGSFHLLETGPAFPVKIRSTRSRLSEEFYAYYCQEALMLQPDPKSNIGWLGIMDRGLLVSISEVDLGFPGAFLLCGRGDLKMDVGGTAPVRDEQWEQLVSQHSKRTVRRVKQFYPLLQAGTPSYQLVKTFLEALG